MLPPWFASHPTAAHLFPFALVVVIVWSLIWKGFALWYAATGRQKAWFIVFLIVNTLGILEIIYLIWFRPHYSEIDTQPEDSSVAA